MADGNGVFFARCGDRECIELEDADCFFEICFFGVEDLNEDCGILCEENLDKVILATVTEAVGEDFETALCVGEYHFKQSSDKTAGAYIVDCLDIPSGAKHIDAVERIDEVLGVFYIGRFTAYFAEGLFECRSQRIRSRQER